MALPPQKFREIVFQLLYSQGFISVERDSAIPFYMAELKVTRRSVAEAYDRMAKIVEKLSSIDEMIRESSDAYEFDRISTVEKNLLRLGVFEMLFDEEIPPKVAIVEAIRLCRKFGTPESSHFVNAVLDAILQKHGKENREGALSC